MARAYAPHCDSGILHFPGKCKYCDEYSDWQEARIVQGINFTGGKEVGLMPCPSEVKRPIDRINLWVGNVPVPAEPNTKPVKGPTIIEA